jgi:uncharacterized protein YndB with AHSA1/START domain
MKHENTAGEQRLTFDYELEAPPEKVWRALTIPAFVDRWLLPIDKSAGAKFAGRAEGLAGSVEAEIIDLKPPRQLSWSWREAGEPAGIVTFTLTPSDGGGTLLHLVHTRRAAPALQPAANSNAVTMMLAA